VKVEIDQQDLEKLKFTLFGVKNAVPHVIKRSVNETIKSTISFAAKEIASHYNLTQTRIKKDFTPNTQKATFAKPSGAVIAKGKPVSLTTFQRTRQVAKGVSVQIKKDRARWVGVMHLSGLSKMPGKPGIDHCLEMFHVAIDSIKSGNDQTNMVCCLQSTDTVRDQNYTD